MSILFIYEFIYLYIYILVAPSGKLLVSSLVEQDVQERLCINAWFPKSCFHVNWQSIGVCVMYTSLIEKGAVATILMLSMWEIACTKIIFFLDAARRFRSCDQSSHCRSTTLQVAVLVLSFFWLSSWPQPWSQRRSSIKSLHTRRHGPPLAFCQAKDKTLQHFSVPHQG